MNDKFEKFVNEIVNDRGLNNVDKTELKYEILDHLTLSKSEHIKNGYSENEAIDLAIINFGEKNIIGNDIKYNLPSKNKYNDLTKLDKLSCLLSMFICYFLYSFTRVGVKFEYFNILIVTLIVFMPFIYVNVKVKNVNIRIKNILIINMLFLLSEKLIISRTIPFFYQFSFSWIYMITYILLVLITILITKFCLFNIANNIRNPYNIKILNSIILTVSIITSVIYFLIFNNRYILSRFLQLFDFNMENARVYKNVFYIFINEIILIPNVGLMLFFILLIKFIVYIKRKGIKSLL